jgi:hypothetical protein
LSQHLEERFEQALSHGASEEEAKQLALEELTLPDSFSDQIRRVAKPLRHTPVTIGGQRTHNRLAGVCDDIRFGLRILAKQPGFAVVAILTLGIGVGMSTLMLSIVHDVLIRPLPYANPERLYAIWASSDSAGQTRVAASGPDYLDYRSSISPLFISRNTSRVLLSPGREMASQSWSIALRHQRIFSRRLVFGHIWAACMNRASTPTSRTTAWWCHTGSGRTSLEATRT